MGRILVLDDAVETALMTDGVADVGPGLGENGGTSGICSPRVAGAMPALTHIARIIVSRLWRRSRSSVLIESWLEIRVSWPAVSVSSVGAMSSIIAEGCVNVSGTDQADWR